MPTTSFDWTGWTPTEHATLLYVVRDGEILLIRKKRGLGAGLLNGAGGRVESHETPLAAAIREFEEELRATPESVQRAGDVWFHVLNGPAIHIHVFRSPACRGAPRETDEAIPHWAPVDDVPYDEMWPDDRHWFPHLLNGRPFHARAVFEGDEMLACDVSHGDPP